MWTSAELINNNLDKLALSDHSIYPHHHATEETIMDRTKDMTDSSLDQCKALLDQSPAALGEYTDSLPEGNLNRLVGETQPCPSLVIMPADFMKQWLSSLQLYKNAKPGKYCVGQWCLRS